MVNWNEVIQELNDLGFRNNELIEFNMREEDTEEDSIEIGALLEERFPDANSIRQFPNMFRNVKLVCAFSVNHSYNFTDMSKREIAEHYAAFFNHVYGMGFKLIGYVDYRNDLNLFFWKKKDYEKITKALKDEDD